ncbi:MAG TPA: DUF5011 domain-containing protein, partial [Desulfobulbus sp.]|nr:DUF5011 domain-containing protein [Desulfobulbus sp.]
MDIKRLHSCTDKQTPALIHFLPALIGLCIGIVLLPAMATGADIDSLLPTYHLLLFSKHSKQKIFIIGDSTVHRHATDYLINNAGMNCGDDNTTPPTIEGWGDELKRYAIHPENVTNNARQGASSEEYKTPPVNADVGHDRNWQVTRSLMEQADGGILLIQFGSYGNEKRLDPNWDDNDGPDWNVIEQKFKQNLVFYITKARGLGALPILVTPPDGRLDGVGSHADGFHPHTRGQFPTWIHEVGSDTGTELLDLNIKSNNEFAKYSDAVLLREFGDCHYNSGYVDRVHYEPQGAEKVAGWVKELACTQLTDRSLCAQFSTTNDKVIPEINLNGSYYVNLPAGEQFTDPGATAFDDHDGNISSNIVVHGVVHTDEAGEYPITYDVQDSHGNHAIQVTRIVRVNSGITVREDAEDGDIANWEVYDGDGNNDGEFDGLVTNIFDNEKHSQVIELNGPNGTDDGFRYYGDNDQDWNTPEESVISWCMKYSENFTVFVSAQTNNGYRIFVYQPTDNGMEITNNGARYRFSLGTDV